MRYVHVAISLSYLVVKALLESNSRAKLTENIGGAWKQLNYKKLAWLTQNETSLLSTDEK